MKKARSHHSKIIQDLLDLGNEEDFKGTYLMMQWNLLLGNETTAMLSGAMEGEYDNIQDDFQPLFYDEIEEYRGGIKICG